MTFNDPNREAVGQPPIWSGAGEGGGDVVAPQPGGFDPAQHTVEEVNTYLADHPDESDTVLELERAGKARVGVLGE